MTVEAGWRLQGVHIHILFTLYVCGILLGKTFLKIVNKIPLVFFYQLLGFKFFFDVYLNTGDQFQPKENIEERPNSLEITGHPIWE